MKDGKDTLMIGQASDGRLVQRPLSPHLQVYRPQITSVLSIMNRVTGLAASAGTLLLVWWLAAAATGPQAFGHVQSFVASPIGLFMLFGWTASLFYHFFGGLRHLAWDAGWGYELDKTHLTGWAAITATVVCTLAVWIAGLIVMRVRTMADGLSIKIRRSQLGRVRGVGSAKSGVHHWYAERVTSLALIPLTLWFVFSMVRLAGASQEFVAAWAAHPWNAVLLLALIGMTFHHMALGIQVVLEDYVGHKWFMTIGILVTKAVCGLLALTAALSVLKLALQ